MYLKKNTYFNYLHPCYLQRKKCFKLCNSFRTSLVNTIDFCIWFRQNCNKQINKKNKTIVNLGLNLYLIWLEISISKYVFLVTVKGILYAIEIFYKSLSLPPLVLEDTRFDRYLSHDLDVTKIQNGGSCDVYYFHWFSHYEIHIKN